MDSFSSDLLWDGATRDLDAERTEMARTAALADVEPLWSLFSGAATESDLANRLALADGHLRTAAARRGYGFEALVADVTAQWKLIVEARALQAKARAAETEHAKYNMGAQASVTEQGQILAYVSAVGRLTARAALDNPNLPLAECQRLAEEALAKTAEAYPLAYESWGNVADGPITNQVKNWQPPGLPKSPAAATPAATPAAATPAAVGPAADDDDDDDDDLGGPAPTAPGRYVASGQAQR